MFQHATRLYVKAEVMFRFF